jgi:hypothetical protein
MLVSVITTIHAPTPSVFKLAEKLAGCDNQLVIAGDIKGPASFELVGVADFRAEQLTFLHINTQLSGDFELGRQLPTGHYARKNIGYLHAISIGASCIYETDDDNAPLPSWSTREQVVNARMIGATVTSEEVLWVNVYKHFTDENIWPRGLPLNQIHTAIDDPGEPQETRAPIQQGLANGSPDVDALWRMVMNREFTFANNASVMVQPGYWCPFNTQSTWWWPEVFPLLYIPSNCSFRMCDIWKSFVAQRCLWELGTGVVFHAPEVYQERNPHNLMRDFNDEIVGYQQNHRIAGILQGIKLDAGTEAVAQNLRTCYSALVEQDVFPPTELDLVEAWLAALEKLGVVNIR